ncbi:HigA family addiction module antitoxin [Parabacteroides bouchesdurhonensis]|uniref:HigA family addiction module antitoxin n=1 Tax=Parabacteroides bouchesdurhonensis TaxID=1936995 RepID=UPI000C8572C3|nr:HigA family addiction module antitoxin [Parabacteroides bouchesdurhonensis]
MNKELRPYIPTHPGEVLKDELQARKITQKKFSELTSISYTMQNEILNSKRPITADVALILEAALGVDASFWVNMQSRYNLEMARRDKKSLSKLNEIHKVCASFLL